MAADNILNYYFYFSKKISLDISYESPAKHTSTPYHTGHKINPFKCPKKGTLANSVDLDQMLENAASDQALHCYCIKLRNFYKTL